MSTSAQGSGGNGVTHDQANDAKSREGNGSDGGFRAGNYGELDNTALSSMANYKADEFPRVQARADKWIAGLTTITGLLGTVIVVKGTESFNDLADKRELLGVDLPTKTALIVLMGLGTLLLVASIFFSYMAAYGTPLQGTEAEEAASGAWNPANHGDKSPATYWYGAINESVKQARNMLTIAVISTVAGLACLAGALVLAWTTPEAGSGTGTCLQTPTGLVELSGVPVIKSGSVTLTACPS